MRLVALALFVFGCSDVAEVQDAAVADSFQCGTGETVCSGATCANTMTDEQNCGACGTQCAPTEGCAAGSCIPAGLNCARVREIDATAPDGLYRNPQTGVAYYCDFTNDMTYEGFGVGQFNVAYANYVLMSSTNFNEPALQAAFVALYNEQLGLINLGPGFNSANCCFKSADSVAGQMLTLGASPLHPAKAASDYVQCTGPYSDARYRLFADSVSEYSPLPMPSDYFATRPGGVATACVDSTNPGIFMRRRAGLN